MTSDIFFDNFIISGDRRVVDDCANDGWGRKKAADGAAEVSDCSLIVDLYPLLGETDYFIKSRFLVFIFLLIQCQNI